MIEYAAFICYFIYPTSQVLYVLYIPIDFCLFKVMLFFYANDYLNAMNKKKASESD